MYKLYCRKTAGSMAVEALLAACGAAYEAIDLERQPDGSFPEFFHRINPKAEVPTLVLPDGSIMTESAAMMIHLADLYAAAGLAPAITAAERPRYLRWMVFLATALYNSDLRCFYPQRFTTNPAEADGIKARAEETMSREFEILADALGQGPFLVGDKLSAADIYAAMLVSWAPDVGATFARHPNLKTMYDVVTRVPAVKAVWDRNGA